MSLRVLKGRGGIPGRAGGKALVSRLSLQGDSAIDIETGRIIQKGHPLEGENISGRVLVLSGRRGSTGWSCRLHAAFRNGVGPSALVFPRMDARTASAAAALQVPLVTDMEEDPFEVLLTGDELIVDGDAGTVEVLARQKGICDSSK